MDPLRYDDPNINGAPFRRVDREPRNRHERRAQAKRERQAQRAREQHERTQSAPTS